MTLIQRKRCGFNS